ncbi:MAG: hypothetical protein GX144_08220 [Clostridiaceae bacterium]|nr:hypothetical protein [Clostridiaceae bacterium]
MAGKVLILIEDRPIKGIILKTLHEKKLEFMEGLDVKDLQMKLKIFQDTIIFLVIQISSVSYKEQFSFVKSVKDNAVPSFPVFAIIPSDSREFVGSAKKAGIEDVVLIPENRERFHKSFIARLNAFMEKNPVIGQVLEAQMLHKSNVINLLSDEELKYEIKRANRGKYSVSFVMGKFAGVHIEQIQNFYITLKKEMRDTDRIISYDYHSFVVVCPFTVKSYRVEVEKKIRDAFETAFGGYSRVQRLNMYGVTYPDDGESISELVTLMDKGVHDSMIISSIQEPLNEISRGRLEEYRNMLKLYK